MNNRWSDAARLAALAVRQGRAFAANPNKGNAVPQQGGRAPKPAGQVPPPNIWIAPNGGVGTRYEEGMKDLVAKKKLMGANPLPQPNIFYSSTGPKPATAATPQGSIRYDPKQPDHPQSPMPPMPPPGGGTGKTKTTDGTRVIIGGLRYTRVGNKLVPDVIDKTGKVKNFYLK